MRLPIMAILQFANSSFFRTPTWIPKTQSMCALNVFKLLYQNMVSSCVQHFDPFHRFFSGWTPLHYSANNGQLETCKVLVSLKVDLAARDRYGRCRCCSRFSLNESHPLACSQGYTALEWAMNENESDVVSFLRSVGAPEWFRHLVEHVFRVKPKPNRALEREEWNPSRNVDLTCRCGALWRQNNVMQSEA